MCRRFGGAWGRAVHPPDGRADAGALGASEGVPCGAHGPGYPCPQGTDSGAAPGGGGVSSAVGGGAGEAVGGRECGERWRDERGNVAVELVCDGEACPRGHAFFDGAV